MCRVGIGMQEGDSNGLDTGRGQHCGQVVEPGNIQRRHCAATRIEPLAQHRLDGFDELAATLKRRIGGERGTGDCSPAALKQNGDSG